MTPVRWESVDPATYEKMVAVLLNVLSPDVQRIDGTGGDGGRDAQFRNGDANEIYELKSFSGRMKNTRRAQVVKSLARARSHGPTHWFLVVPIDHSPAEEKWFNSLRQNESFPLTWRGRTWLDARMAEHPEIPRYFLEDSRDEVLSLMKELREAGDVVPSVRNALQRLTTLHVRLNELDPYFRYDLATGVAADTPLPPGAILAVTQNGTRVVIRERYVGALKDRPITMTATMRFGAEDQELQSAFVRSLEFGDPVTLPSRVVQAVHIDAPGGLGEVFGTGEIELASSPVPSTGFATSLDIARGSRVIASLPVTLSPQSSGTRGMVFEGDDTSGWIHVTGRTDAAAKQMTLNLRIVSKTAVPAALRPLLNWIKNVGPPNRLLFRMRAGGPVVGRMTMPKGLLDSNALVEVYEAIADIQQAASAYFEVSPDFTRQEIVEIFGVRTILKGGVLSGEWSSGRVEMTLVPGVSLPDVFSTAEGTSVRLEKEEVWNFKEHEVPLGRIETILESVR